MLRIANCEFENEPSHAREKVQVQQFITIRAIPRCGKKLTTTQEPSHVQENVFGGFEISNGPSLQGKNKTL